MSEVTRIWVEITFNVLYLLTVWTLVILMTLRQSKVNVEEKKLAKRILWAFVLLALGDTGHVGFRVIAYLNGGLEANPILVGAGAFSTAVTVTFFYMLMLDTWHIRFDKPLGWFGRVLLAAGVVRLLVMIFPQNAWWQITPPYGWSLLRNSFLVIQGLGVMGLFFRDAIREKDRTFIWIGSMIALSFAFYTPVILWVNQIALLGMLMIPKTCVYLAVAFIAYKALYFPSKSFS